MFISIHGIQSLPPSNPNRGKDGEPKHAPLGGVVRAAPVLPVPETCGAAVVPRRF
jgi:hypothetical protein